MYTSALYNPENILQIAREDLQAYIDAIPPHKIIHDYFDYSKNELHYSESVDEFQEYNEISPFIENYLDWLDRQYPAHSPGDFQRQFMEILEKWLLKLTQSKLARIDRLERAPYLFDYGGFIVKRTFDESYSLEFLTQMESGFNLRGLPSFLFISPNRRTASIVVDEKQVKSRNRRICEKRYEMCILHETAHIRLHGEWITRTQARTGQRQVVSRPVFESDAWLYTFAVLGCISGLRSRLTRLLREEDNEAIVSA